MATVRLAARNACWTSLLGSAGVEQVAVDDHSEEALHRWQDLGVVFCVTTYRRYRCPTLRTPDRAATVEELPVAGCLDGRVNSPSAVACGKS